MKINGIHHTSIWPHPEQSGVVCIVDQRHLPHRWAIAELRTAADAATAIANGVPFYVAAPSSSIDFSLAHGSEVPIEQRGATEVLAVSDGQHTVSLAPEGSDAVNYAFDVTPAELVTGLITERGICPASEARLRTLFPERYGH